MLAVIVATTGGLGPIPAHAAGGDTLWESRYAGPIRYDSAYSMAVSPDGARVFVTGYSSRDFATVAYAAATGAALWVSRYDSGVDFARSMAVSPDGARVFVTGTSYRGPGRSYDYVTVAYDAATGATLWVRRYNGPRSGDDEAYSVGVSPDGARVFVTGGSWGGFTTDLDYTTVAYDAATGATLWGRRYDGPGNGGDIAHVVAVSREGTRVFVTGYTDGGSATGYDYTTLAYNAATGATLWDRRYKGSGNGTDEATSMAVSPARVPAKTIRY